ncbi:MAG TPA: Hsp33 family molecular chaperone HslO [Erysipelotrichaceae bacterium]|mgnify:CR=1 FL=1|nr:Hsp33 family molecular chaperone HslO [Erysipelotrichaceae bacterium]HCY07054.1 Hsp33 family molecular chaperone HslO [Erysipelotrichaceae bacterium]
MNEVLIGTALDDKVRIYCLNSTNLVEKTRLLHDLWPTASAALGRVESVVAIMASLLKGDDEKIVVSINGGGPIGTILVEAKGNGDIRGFVSNNEVYLKYDNSDKLAVGLAVGTDGYLSVSRNMGLKESFTSKVKLQTGEIGDDFAYYFAVSEQTLSVVSVGVLVDVDYSIKAAGGLLIQLLPNHTEETIVQVEELLKRLKPISSLIDEGYSSEEIMNDLFDDVKILGKKEIRWNCDCSKERFRAALATLDVSDLKEMIKEDHGAHIKCEFCNSEYEFNEDDLKNIVEFKSGF